VRVGELVIAIGNPFGLETSLSLGVVSARNRDVNQGRYDDFIQTDAAINRGNSGGPLFNLDGDVIGVNSAILSPTGASVGIGFAIPANLARSVVQQLLTFGETRRGWLGVGIQAVTIDLARTVGLPRPSGALVHRVDAGGPADLAGIEPGDLILTFDGRQVPDERWLSRTVADTAAGKRVFVELLRNKTPMTIEVTISRLAEPGDRPTSRAPEGSDGQATTSIMGLTVASLSDGLRRRYGIPADTVGVVVLGVEPTSDAYGKISVGDVIAEVSWRPVGNTDDFASLVRAAVEAGGQVLMLVHQNGEPVFHALMPFQKQ
jgi:serine protease Do